MHLKDAPAVTSHSFDDEDLVAAAGLVPVMRLLMQRGFPLWRRNS